MANQRQILAALLPGEGQLDLAQIRLSGNQRLQIENHQGVIAYSQEQIKIATKCGLVIIRGQELEILHVDRETMNLSGRIDCLEFGP